MSHRLDYDLEKLLPNCIIRNWAEFKLWLTGSQHQREHWFRLCILMDSKSSDELEMMWQELKRSRHIAKGE